MLTDLLNLTTVQVGRKTETPDGMGANTATTVLTTLSRASIWSSGSNNRYLSEKVNKASTHVLALVTGEYTFLDTDYTVVYDGFTYKLTGHADDVANRGEITVIGMERIS